MNTDEVALLVAVLTLFFTAFGTYISCKEHYANKRGRPKEPKCRHRKSNRQSLRKITVAFSIKVTKK